MKLYKKIQQVAISLKHVPSPCSSIHFTFITRRNNVIALGWNESNKTHPIANTFGHRFNLIHSELGALNHFPYPISHLSKYRLINIRLTHDDELAMSKPCKRCRKMLRHFNVNEIEYSTTNDFKTLYL